MDFHLTIGIRRANVFPLSFYLFFFLLNFQRSPVSSLPQKQLRCLSHVHYLYTIEILGLNTSTCCFSWSTVFFKRISLFSPRTLRASTTRAKCTTWYRLRCTLHSGQSKCVTGCCFNDRARFYVSYSGTMYVKFSYNSIVKFYQSRSYPSCILYFVRTNNYGRMHKHCTSRPFLTKSLFFFLLFLSTIPCEPNTFVPPTMRTAQMKARKCRMTFLFVLRNKNVVRPSRTEQNSFY